MKRETFTFWCLVLALFMAVILVSVHECRSKKETIYHLPNGHDYTMVKRGNDVYFDHHKEDCLGCNDIVYIYDCKKDSMYVKYDSVGSRGVVYKVVKPCGAGFFGRLKKVEMKTDTVVVKERPARKTVIPFDTAMNNKVKESIVRSMDSITNVYINNAHFKVVQ